MFKEVKMKIVPIGNTISQAANRKALSFQGVTTNYQIPKGKEDLKNNSYWHKNSSIEEAVGAYHKNYTGKAYFAHPMEHVNDSIKDKVDYVVYDNEPKYPSIDDVKENYLGKQRKNLREDFDEVREYYYRREIGGSADVNEAKYKQWEAAELTGFYDRAGNARYRKEGLEDRIETINKNINKKEEEISLLQQKIQEKNAEKEVWETKNDNYVKKDKKYGELQELSKKTIERDKAEVDFITKQIGKMKDNIERCKSGINHCINEIANARINISTRKDEINKLNAEKTIKTKELNTIIDKELKPMFNALKDFCKLHRIKL